MHVHLISKTLSISGCLTPYILGDQQLLDLLDSVMHDLFVFLGIQISTNTYTFFSENHKCQLLVSPHIFFLESFDFAAGGYPKL